MAPWPLRSVDSSGHITAVAPAGVEGTVDVRVGNVTGLIAASSAARFTFTMPPAAAPGAAVAPPAERRQSVKPRTPLYAGDRLVVALR